MALEKTPRFRIPAPLSVAFAAVGYAMLSLPGVLVLQKDIEQFQPESGGAPWDKNRCIHFTSTAISLDEFVAALVTLVAS